MKRVLKRFKDDNYLRANILFAAFLAFMLANITVIVQVVDNFLRGQSLQNIKQVAIPIIYMDIVFFIILSFMYVIQEKFFSVKAAVIASLVIGAGSNIYFGVLGTQAPLADCIATFIQSTIYIFYPLLGFGILLKLIWETVQDRVGGEYSSNSLNFKNVLSNRNLIFFSVSIVIYALSELYLQRRLNNYKMIGLALIMGIGVFGCCFILRILLNLLLAAKGKIFSRHR